MPDKWNSGKKHPKKPGIYVGQVVEDCAAEDAEAMPNPKPVPKRVLNQRKVSKAWRKKIKPAEGSYPMQSRRRKRKSNRGIAGTAPGGRRGRSIGKAVRQKVATRLKTLPHRKGRSRGRRDSGWADKAIGSESFKNNSQHKKAYRRKYRRDHSFVYFDGKKFLNIYRSHEVNAIKWRDCTRREELSVTKTVWKYPHAKTKPVN